MLSNLLKIILKYIKYVFFILSVLLTGVVQTALAEGCDPKCTINVVWENIYHSPSDVLNLNYSYVPTSQWSAESCVANTFAEDEGIDPPFNGTAYLFGWAKAYYNGTQWVLFGGLPAKFFLTQTTPFHPNADAHLTLSLYDGQTISQQLGERFPNGCSHMPKPENNFGPACSVSFD